MAKQAEGFLVGTYDDITFYEMKGEYYARMKSSLTGQKFWTHRSFAGSRKSCNRFGRGNQLASMVYNEIPEPQRIYALFCRMKSAAIAMIKAGKNEEEVVNALREMKPVIEPVRVTPKQKSLIPAYRMSTLFRSIPFEAAFLTKLDKRNSTTRCQIDDQRGEGHNMVPGAAKYWYKC